MTTVKQVLDQKGRNVWTLPPDASVYDALAKMAEKNVGALVITEGERMVGIITEREYARNIALKGRTSPTTRVTEIMESKVLYVRPEDSVEACMALMTAKYIRHLPVLVDGKLAGIVSIGDLVRTVIADQKFVIEQLARYIQG